MAQDIQDSGLGPVLPDIKMEELDLKPDIIKLEAIKPENEESTIIEVDVISNSTDTSCIKKEIDWDTTTYKESICENESTKGDVALRQGASTYKKDTVVSMETDYYNVPLTTLKTEPADTYIEPETPKMPKDTRVSEASYQKHVYSGPSSSSRKRVAVGLEASDEFTSIQTNRERPKILRTYSRAKPKKLFEATSNNEIFDVSSSGQINNIVETTGSGDHKVVNDVKLPKPEPEKEKQITTDQSNTDPLCGISGNRIVDLKHVLQWAFQLENHRQTCASQIKFIKENQIGFHSEFTFECSICYKTWLFSNEKEHKINKSFVWATVTAGSCYSQAAHITNLMDIPTISQKTFTSTETKLSHVWSEYLTEEIKKAGEQERDIAIRKGHVSSDGVPYTTVYVDGGWLKRTYGHNFDSSGMACIIGKETKKCLFLSVRYKYCYICKYHESRGLEPKSHNCCNNFNKKYTSTESDMIVEGFICSQETHNLRYHYFIEDGDSAVFRNLKQNVPYGYLIKKIESKNHVIKNYTGALYKILANTKLPLHSRNIFKQKLSKLIHIARKIIIRNTKDPDSMAEDLRNSPLHIFGQHKNCKRYYCTVDRISPGDCTSKTSTVQESLVDILKDKTREVALIFAATDRVAMKAGRISNETTNVAENFMNVINKFICRKQLCVGKSGCYQRRVYISGLSQSVKWQNFFGNKSTAQSPVQYLKKNILDKNRSKFSNEKLVTRRLSQINKQPDKDSSPTTIIIDPNNINVTHLKIVCENKILGFQEPPDRIAQIEIETRGQHYSKKCLNYRANRLTTSQFGLVCKRRSRTPCDNHVKDILYNKDIHTPEFGYQNKDIARKLFEQQTGKTVRLSGFYIDEEFGFLGASPDGIIEEENSVVEIKYFVALQRRATIEEAAKDKSFPLQLENNTLVINKKHKCYYHVQGHLRVTKMEKCYFICFGSINHQLVVIEVPRDDVFIAAMIPKLVDFFKHCLLPEIILRRVERNNKCINIKELEARRTSEEYNWSKQHVIISIDDVDYFIKEKKITS